MNMTGSTENREQTNRLRLAIAGCELARLRYHSALLRNPEWEVCAFADPDDRLAKVWSRELGVKAETFLDAADLPTTQPDAVLVAEPLEQRADTIAEALRAGLPVLTEMPPSTDLNTLDDLHALAAQQHIPLIPLLPRRFHPHAEALQQLLQQGALGTLQHTRCSWAYPLEDYPPDPLSAGQDWNAIFQAVASQTLDLCTLWHDEPLTVSADLGVEFLVKGGRKTGRLASDAALATLITSHHHGQATHQIMHTRSVRPEERYLLTGSKGQAELTLSAGPTSDPAPALVVQLHSETARQIQPILQPDEEKTPPALCQMHRLMHYCAQCVRGEITPVQTPHQMRRQMETIHASYVSTYEESKITLPLLHTPNIQAMMHILLSLPQALPPGP